MTPSNGERRYSEDEFALVLRMASEPEEGRGPTSNRLSPREGMTLGEIREIAAEVGIEPDRVSRAAALLPAPETSGLNRLIGGSPRHRVEHAVFGVVPAGEFIRVIEAARRMASTQGETREVIGGLEWTGGTGTASFGASIRPRGSETELQAWTNRTETMMGIYGGVGMPILGVVAFTLVKLVFGETDAGIVASLLLGIPPAFLFAREVWKRSTKKYRERLLHLLDAMTREAEAAVEDSGPHLGDGRFDKEMGE